MMSKVLKVSSSGYYKWKSNKVAIENKYKILDKAIKEIFNGSKGTYGSPRIAVELNKKDTYVSKNTVARRMQVINIAARPKKRFVITTKSNHDFQTPDNLLDRNFDVQVPNSVWVSDITYIRVANFWMYLTVILDLADRMVVGWSLSNDMSTEKTVIPAFNMAAVNRGITKNHKLLFHSDRGVQYACKAFTDLLKAYQCIQSMSRKGNCWDNAVAESFFKTIKVESLNKYIINDKMALYKTIFRYIEGWYNTIRIHSAIGNMAPIDVFKLKSVSLAA